MDESDPTPTPPPPPREFRPGHKHGASTPILISMYANRPLPPLPPEAYAPTTQAKPTTVRSRRATASEGLGSPVPARKPLAGRNRCCSNAESTHVSSPQLLPVFTASSPIVTPTQRNSHTPPSRHSRRSSQKIHQLIGQDVDVMDDVRITSGSVRSDSSSDRSKRRLSNLDVPDCHLVPVLEADDIGASSRGSSWGPMPPDSADIPAPLMVHKPNLDGSNRKEEGLTSSIANLRLDDDLVQPWHPAYGQFSDVGAAGEYHRFTANLASRHSRQVSAESFLLPQAAESATTKKKKRSSFSFARSAAAKLSRRRDHPEFIDTTSLMPPSQQRPSSAKSFFAAPTAPSAPSTPRIPMDVAPPRPPPAPPLVSAWDSDSDEEEPHVMAHLKDWFTHKTGNESKGHRRASSAPRINSDGRVPARQQEAQSRSQDRVREKRTQADREKAATKRREELLKHTLVIPEEMAPRRSRYT